MNLKTNPMKFTCIVAGLTMGISAMGHAATAKSFKGQDTVRENVVSGLYSFESADDLAVWKTAKGKLSLSDAHYKDGKQALAWNWTKGDALSINKPKGLEKATDVYPGGIPERYEPAYYPKGRYGGIKMWLYQEKPQAGKMTFNVGADEQSARNHPKYTFSVDMDFTGWRTVWVNFEEDAKVKNYTGSNVMTSIYAYPGTGMSASGTLFIDHFTLLTFVSNKRHSDMLFKNNKLELRSDDSYEIREPYLAYRNAKFSQQQYDKADFAKQCKLIEDRLEFLMLGDGSADWQKRGTGIEKDLAAKIKKANNNYKDLGLKNENGYVNGKPLFAIRDEQGAPEGGEFQAVSQNIFFPLAFDYRVNHSEESKEKLMEALDYFQDQGWAAGSGTGTVDHVIRLNPVADAVFLLRKDLKAKGKLPADIDMLVWHSRLGSLLDIDYTKGENTDKVRGGALVKLINILLLDDGPQKKTLLEDFAKYMDHVIDYAPGYSDTFKPDYSVFHHRGTYLNTYGINAVATMTLIHWLLQGTPYHLSERSTTILKEGLTKQAEIAFGVDLHYGVCGRLTQNNSAIDGFLLPAFAFMATGVDKNDEDLAQLFNYLYDVAKPAEVNAILTPALTYCGTLGTLDLMVRLHESCKGKMKRPGDGSYVMPYSGLMSYRQGNAFATVKGYNQYVWDYEAGTGENNMGRYLSFGTLITAQGNEKQGFEGQGMDMNAGFHWGYLPGATTKAMPAEKILYYATPNAKYEEGQHRNFSRSLFASGLSQQGKNGMYAVDLRDNVGPDKDVALFDSTFRAKKSYFFIGNEVICLGSDIANTDKRYHTVTTLFQYRVNNQSPTQLNGNAIGTSLSIDQYANGGYLTDQNGVHYIFGKDQKVRLMQGEQSSFKLEKSNYQPISSPHVKAYIDHGAAPQKQGYEYELLLNTPADQVAPYLAKKSYEVYEKDADAHIIYHPASGITAYAVFTANKVLKGPVVKTDVPLLAMFKKEDNNAVLTIANPDLNLEKWGHNMSRMPENITNAVSKGSFVTVTVKGEWYPAQYVADVQSITHVNGNSLIKVYCKDGKSIDIPLQVRP
ncbi:chondroitin-sulfate-ABC endolyase/exolyase [Mucilaginibacter yixingensis]|uniref:Chondroitin-sulfate-ABC endolyase/exolyase n=1 Tax=Mucilaginibacter yixingensis TaxID=1295612 RepID=A0A2T5J663_9SPHI|nr:chondroitinase family polysaccharide lyase [Mucilaginibacter yixingensis]PTQ93979.1 chondroitin-sulfate-ABC endolyase/exolyase [Mucilaginibacter yixingensis]